MDFTSISLLPAIEQILSLAMIVVSGYCIIWSVNKVIHLISHDELDPNDPSNYDHDVFNSGPPDSRYTDYDPNGNYFRRDGMWRKYKDFE